VGLCITLALLGNSSLNTFPQQRKIVGNVVFYTFRNVSKKSRRLVLPTTSCLIVLCPPLGIRRAGYVPNIVFFVHLKIFIRHNPHLISRKDCQISTGQEAGWTPEYYWSQR
jgi:hypothetical protein